MPRILSHSGRQKFAGIWHCLLPMGDPSEDWAPCIKRRIRNKVTWLVKQMWVVITLMAQAIHREHRKGQGHEVRI